MSSRRIAQFLMALASSFVLTLGCGSDASGTSNDGGADGSAGGDGGTSGGGVSDGVSGCTEDGPQCDNCIDDDGDGLIDGLDPECSGTSDNDEGSFATGVEGDNIDPVFQDCFFDGDSGEGNDGCMRPTCCLTEGPTDTCPPTPAGSCEASQACIDFCGDFTPPGCDCWGCCTVCNEDGCVDIATGLASDDCNGDTLDDEEKCPRCVKSDSCGSDCEADPCTLCPGQTELPEECEEQVCPDGQALCGDDGSCADGYYCSNGCCVKEHVVD